MAPLLVLVAFPAPARADSNGCTPAPYGTVCIYVRGGGEHVRSWQVGRIKWNPDLVCNYSAQVEVRLPNGKRYFWGERKSHSGCSAEGHFDWSVDENFPDRTRLCGFWWEDHDKLTGGQPCITVEK
ncbi:MAG: hypothetical protein ACRDJO_09480 [Actinomycetota bacterium]